jgi:hypothetical protein
MIDDAGVVTLPLASFRDSSRASAVELSRRTADSATAGLKNHLMRYESRCGRGPASVSKLVLTAEHALAAMTRGSLIMRTFGM